MTKADEQSKCLPAVTQVCLLVRPGRDYHMLGCYLSYHLLLSNSLYGLLHARTITDKSGLSWSSGRLNMTVVDSCHMGSSGLHGTWRTHRWTSSCFSCCQTQHRSEAGWHCGTSLLGCHPFMYWMVGRCCAYEEHCYWLVNTGRECCTCWCEHLCCLVVIEWTDPSHHLSVSTANILDTRLGGPEILWTMEHCMIVGWFLKPLGQSCQSVWM